jgi:hypothetical protein
MGWSRFPKHGEFGRLQTHVGYIERQSRHLSRSIFHAMMRFQAKLERKQMVLFRIVDIGTDLFAMAATISYATMLAKKGEKNALELADLFCREARVRIDQNFRTLFDNHDDLQYRVVQKMMKGEYEWLEGPLVQPIVPTAEAGGRSDSAVSLTAWSAAAAAAAFVCFCTARTYESGGCGRRTPSYYFSPAAVNTGVMSTGMSFSFSIVDAISGFDTPYLASRRCARA